MDYFSHVRSASTGHIQSSGTLSPRRQELFDEFSGYNSDFLATVKVLQDCESAAEKEVFASQVIRSLCRQQKYFELLYFVVIAAKFTDIKQKCTSNECDIFDSLSSPNFFIVPILLDAKDSRSQSNDFIHNILCVEKVQLNVAKK